MKCSVCNGTCKNPFEFSCLHRICRDCLKPDYKFEKKQKCYICLRKSTRNFYVDIPERKCSTDNHIEEVILQCETCNNTTVCPKCLMDHSKGHKLVVKPQIIPRNNIKYTERDEKKRLLDRLNDLTEAIKRSRDYTKTTIDNRCKEAFSEIEERQREMHEHNEDKHKQLLSKICEYIGEIPLLHSGDDALSERENEVKDIEYGFRKADSESLFYFLKSSAIPNVNDLALNEHFKCFFEDEYITVNEVAAEETQQRAYECPELPPKTKKKPEKWSFSKLLTRKSSDKQNTLIEKSQLNDSPSVHQNIVHELQQKHSQNEACDIPILPPRKS
ncbi:unnamed protein product [Dimorphilus gyrociliatus]|uniref:RING-type domain-containing protein n=1 Tax=Dimorphilus gyrociliatus TaxID=2664684 RepID=A0A7I8VVC0_9ANNE|nr:unnamed protein product [Dimorphilus gyrociliatus]